MAVTPVYGGDEVNGQMGTQCTASFKNRPSGEQGIEVVCWNRFANSWFPRRAPPNNPTASFIRINDQNYGNGVTHGAPVPVDLNFVVIGARESS